MVGTEAALAQQQDDGALSGAAELAAAGLLLRGIGVAPALAYRDRNYGDPLTPEQHARWQKNRAIVKDLWDSRYAKPQQRTPQPASDYDDGEPEWIDHREERLRDRGIEVGYSTNNRNYFARVQGDGNPGPSVRVTPQARPSTLAHEMGHAEMYASANQLGKAASDVISKIQENKYKTPVDMQQLAGMSRRSRDWRHTLLPMSGVIAGLATGAVLGDSGATIGGLVGAATGLPLLAVEAEAWRRGAQYARAMGISRRRYAADAFLPLMSYAALPVMNAGLGMLAGELASDATSGKMG